MRTELINTLSDIEKLINSFANLDSFEVLIDNIKTQNSFFYIKDVKDNFYKIDTNNRFNTTEFRTSSKRLDLLNFETYY